MTTSIGVIGTGKFGVFLIERIREYQPKTRIFAWDKNKTSTYSLDTVLESNAIIFAVPPKEYEAAMREMVPRTKPGTLIVDICTVKVHTLDILREIAHTRPYISMHPLFGPQSYKDNGNSLKGEQVVVCGQNMREGDYIGLTRFLEARGLEFVEMTAEQHDYIQAVGQLLPQRIASVVKRAGLRLDTRVHTRSGMHFYRAMEIVGEDEELFKQVAQLNPFWGEVWAKYVMHEAALNYDMLASGATH